MTTKRRADGKSDQQKMHPKPVCQMKRAPMAPAVYRPQPTPHVLQRKMALGEQQTPATKSRQPPPASPTTTKGPTRNPVGSPRVVQPKSIAKTVFASRLTTPRSAQGAKTVIQRMESRPRREGINYEFNYSAKAPSDLENLSNFVRQARVNIAALKRRVTLQPERNLPLAERGEETKAYLRAKAMQITVGEGSSGGNQHGEISCLNAAQWHSGIQGYQYYFVCEGGKPSCYLCTAIASLLKIAVAGTDDSTYPDYVAPACLQTDDNLWRSFIGDDAHELWLTFGESRRNRLRSNLGWVHDLGLYWQG
jgi:hypothetical protein